MRRYKIWHYSVQIPSIGKIGTKAKM
jgi:hypothetical protein